MRSIIESIAYDHFLTKQIIQSLVPELDLKTVTVIGSGANSAFWMQLKADILQVPYQNLFRSDLSTLGSALLAGYSISHFTDIEKTIKNIVKTDVKVSPTPGEDKKHAKFIDIYGQLFSTLKEIYVKISS